MAQGRGDQVVRARKRATQVATDIHLGQRDPPPTAKRRGVLERTRARPWNLDSPSCNRTASLHVRSE